MMKVAPLHINIPNPCTEDWEAMLKDGDGRLCTKCNNTVYDFSQMNDEELFDFFRQRPSTHCGRFHNSQLNREILPVITRKKLLLSKFNKIAAAFFTVLSFKAFPLQASNDRPSTELDANFKKNVQPIPGKIIISGTIKNAEGNPLEKATVSFDSVAVATTDAEGKYSFELESVTSTSHLIYFNYKDLVTVVRNYHPVMLSTSYDIKLYKTENIGTSITGGVIDMAIFDLPSLVFKTKEVKLNADNRTLLSIVAAKMKANPTAAITVTASPAEHHGQPICNSRLNNIKKYLVEKEGIAADRITLNSEYGGDPNTIDLKSN